VIQLRGREKGLRGCRRRPPRAPGHTSGTPKTGGAACRLYLGLQLQEPFRLLPLQPILDLGGLTFDVTP
jgi:hypothetical protein